VFLKDPPEKAAAAAAAAGAEGKTKKKKDKGKKAIVEFAKGNWGGCWACWRDHSEESTTEARGLEEGVKVKWAAGKIPDWVEWAEGQRRRTPSDGPERERERQRESRPDPATTRGRDINDQPSTNGLKNGTRTNGAGANGGVGVGIGVGLPGGWGGATGGFTASTPTPSFGSAPDFGGTTMADLLAQHASGKEAKRKEEEYESMTLLRMRQMERERIEEQIRRQEEEEGE
jgi:DnaJ family protein C protein 17